MYILNNEIYWKDEHVGYLKEFRALIFNGLLTPELNSWLESTGADVTEMHRK